MNSNLIIETLYKKYYSGDGFHEVTSSYWREYGEKVTVTRENDDFEFKGKYTTGGKLRSQETPRYTQVGNAIPPLGGEQFGEVLKEMLK